MIEQYIGNLIEKAIQNELIDKRDEVYVRNQILAQLNLTMWSDVELKPMKLTMPQILDELVKYAVEQEIIEDVFDDKEVLKANIMNHFICLPSTVEEKFYEKYEYSPESATDYFYNLSQHSNYIQMEQIKKNVHFNAETHYGDIDITINLSRPEKDPEQIKRERELIRSSINYPKCLLCVENEGYEGRIGHPARSNHRIIKVPLNDEVWYFQYSPYIYYNEHSILLNETHKDMVINRHAFQRLLSFVEKFPHYFIGSNADLPIVGGSILSHDHYQAGRYTFAMDTADTLFTFKLKGHPHIEAKVLKWPLSVIRLQCNSQEELVEASDYILESWKTYTDEQANIKAFTDDIPHNTITPIARRQGEMYEIDLVLRNNRTNEEYPLGIFHPHEDVQHIKKENIGLIEVMGLAVLPARLQVELEEINKYIAGEESHVESYHRPWAKELKEKLSKLPMDDIETFVQAELGKKFISILEDAGVFKQTEKGVSDFKRFIGTL